MIGIAEGHADWLTTVNGSEEDNNEQHVDLVLDSDCTLCRNDHSQLQEVVMMAWAARARSRDLPTRCSWVNANRQHSKQSVIAARPSLRPLSA
jgi:hypothetical protein